MFVFLMLTSLTLIFANMYLQASDEFLLLYFCTFVYKNRDTQFIVFVQYFSRHTVSIITPYR